jgi:hypothetical protein
VRAADVAPRSRLVALALALTFCADLAAGGCGSSGNPADASAIDAADARDDATGGDGAPADGLCNPLIQLGTLVIPACDNGAPPVAKGGTIVDGTYVLTEAHFFGDCSTGALAETVVISQGTVQSIATGPDGGVQLKTVTTTLGQNGTTLSETQTCPIRVMTTISFDATPTTLTIYLTTALATRVSTFTLQ